METDFIPGMGFRFSKHYTLAEARAMLPEVRTWLVRIDELRSELESDEQRFTPPLSSGADLGGPRVDRWIRSMAEMQELLHEFSWREIQIKDLDRGLLDFPSIMDGREVYLCWEKGEDDIDYWHDVDAGYSGREPVDE